MAGFSKRFLAALAAPVVLVLPAFGQELEPRAYSASPSGTNFVVFTCSRSTGDVLLDPSLPIADVESRVVVATVGYMHTFGLAGHSASAAILAPYSRLDATGEVFETQRSAERAGLADVRLRFAVSLLGGPALAPQEFARRPPQSTLGFSLIVVAPTGEYDESKLVNIGTNRWAFRPEFGASWPLGRWFVETALGSWFFLDNDEYFGGHQREQDPLYGIQAHAGYTFRPGLWVAGDATLYRGGDTTVNGVERDDFQSNSRFGLTLSLPAGPSASVKLAWSTGFTTRIGGDLDTYTVGFQYRWFRR